MLVMILKETKLRNCSYRSVPYRSNILGLWVLIKSCLKTIQNWRCRRELQSV